MRAWEEVDLLWQYDKTVKFNGLLQAVYNSTKSISGLDFSLIIDPNSEYAPKYCAYFMNILNIGVISNIIGDAMFWGVSLWGDAYWSGKNLGVRADIAYRYAKFKLFISRKNITYQLIKDALAILVPNASRAEIVENGVNDFTIRIYSIEPIEGLAEIISQDRFLFGKPTGITYNIVYILEV